MKKKKKFIAIVSNDAGGAELLSSYVKNNPTKNYLFVLSGPAKKIFKEKIKKIKIINLKKAVLLSYKLICGTSYVSKLEIEAIKQFNIRGKQTTAILDHWTNYEKRFFHKRNIILPDAIWVFDSYAKQIIQKIFPNLKVILKKNFFLKDLKQKIKKKNYINMKFLNILYVSEPVSEFIKMKIKNYKNSIEYKTFNYFIKNIKSITKTDFNITFRKHPAEHTKKYFWIKKEFKNINFSKNKFLLNDINQSDIVVGRQTMALVLSLLAGRKAISCIPPNEERCVLPYKRIKELRDMV